MAFKMVAAEKAATDQIRQFALISGIEGVEKLDRDELLAQMALAGLSTSHVYVDEDPEPSLGVSAPHAVETAFDPDNERWCGMKISPDDAADDKLSPVFAAVNEDFLYIARGREVIVRERFYLCIKNTVEQRRVQKMQEDGGSGHFKDSERQQVDRYPHSFLGYMGLVKDGRPKVPDGWLCYA